MVKRFVVIARLDIIETQERSKVFTRHSVRSERVLVMDATGKLGHVIYIASYCVIARRSSDHMSVADDNIKALNVVR